MGGRGSGRELTHAMDPGIGFSKNILGEALAHLVSGEEIKVLERDTI